jgi:hypothetical protein
MRVGLCARHAWGHVTRLGHTRQIARVRSLATRGLGQQHSDRPTECFARGHKACSPGLTYRDRTMTRLVRGSVLAVAVLLAFNAAMMAIWFAVGASRDALVVAGWIAGDAMLCLIAFWATDR